MYRLAMVYIKKPGGIASSRLDIYFKLRQPLND
jgi:hypothetical protein